MATSSAPGRIACSTVVRWAWQVQGGPWLLSRGLELCDWLPCSHPLSSIYGWQLLPFKFKLLDRILAPTHLLATQAHLESIVNAVLPLYSRICKDQRDGACVCALKKLSARAHGLLSNPL